MKTHDELMALLAEDPAAFEKYRLDEICALVTKIRNERGEEAARKAGAVQWKIDVIRNRWHLPKLRRWPTRAEVQKNQAIILGKIVAMMADSRAELGKALTKLLESTKC